MNTTHRMTRTLGLTLAAALAIFFVIGIPVGPTIVFIENSTMASTPTQQANASGYIYYGTISAAQQDYAWKAYVGNVTGFFTLDDGGGKTIYDWQIDSATILGELYATRDNGIDWTLVNCSNDSVVLAETQFFGMGLTEADNINNTFNITTHKQMQVAGTTVNASTCRATATYVNSSRQIVNTTSSYQELLLADPDSNLVYGTFIEQDDYNYQDNNVTSDFQILIPENKTKTTPTTYYFYVEIG